MLLTCSSSNCCCCWFCCWLLSWFMSIAMSSGRDSNSTEPPVMSHVWLHHSDISSMLINHVIHIIVKQSSLIYWFHCEKLCTPYYQTVGVVSSASYTCMHLFTHIAGLMIMTSDHTFSSHFKHLTGQTKFGLTNFLYIINVKVIEFLTDKPVCGQFLKHWHCRG